MGEVKFIKKGFTIIELVIVISVLGILIGITVPRMVGMQNSAKIAKVKKELQTYMAAVESYKNFSGSSSYPGTAGTTIWNLGASTLVGAVPNIVNAPLMDPFNPSAEYGYYLSPNGAYYVILSAGPEGIYSYSGGSTVSNTGVVSGLVGDEICVTNGTGC